MLMCNKKGVQNGFPLRIKAEKLVYEETEFNPVFIQHMIRKLEYPALLQAIEDLRSSGVTVVREDGGPEARMDDDRSDSPAPTLPDLPKVLPANWESDEAFLEKMHFVLQDILLLTGALVCPESGREFPVEKGIPNMLLHDDEV
eukprot:g13215.t1